MKVMLPIQDEERFLLELNKRSLVSFFIDTGGHQQVIRELLMAKRDFNERVGSSWDIFFPTFPAGNDENQHAYHRDTYAGEWNFNARLAHRLARTMGIDDAACPALVFSDYQRSEFFAYPLIDTLAGRWQHHIFAIGNICVEVENNSKHLRDEHFKADVSAAVRNYLIPRFRYERVKRVSGFIAATLGVASATIGIYDLPI